MSKKHATIMVIEDEILLLRAIAKKLELSDLNPISCTNGKQALDYLASLPELPDAIWLDYYLKDMNGLDFMHELKKNKKWSHIPVIVVSNSGSEEKVHSMLALGVKKYLLKAQYRLDELISYIKKFIPNNDI